MPARRHVIDARSISYDAHGRMVASPLISRGNIPGESLRLHVHRMWANERPYSCITNYPIRASIPTGQCERPAHRETHEGYEGFATNWLGTPHHTGRWSPHPHDHLSRAKNA